MRTNRDFDRSIVVDCYVQHPEKYGRTFWIGFLMLGGYKIKLFFWFSYYYRLD